MTETVPTVRIIGTTTVEDQFGNTFYPGEYLRASSGAAKWLAEHHPDRITSDAEEESSDD